MTINLMVQSLNNKTVDVINASDFSKTIISSNTNNTIEYSNIVLNMHSNINSFTLSNFWLNLSGLQRDMMSVVLLFVSIMIIYLLVTFIKSSSK